MPEIAPNVWKMTHTFYWIREYHNGTIEREFDLDTGTIRKWGSKTPEGLKKIGWMPVTPDLAAKMLAFGEYGRASSMQSVKICLAPGDEPIIYQDKAVLHGMLYHCKVCGAEFNVFGKTDVCPACGATVMWRCPACGQLSDTEICLTCNMPGLRLTPFKKTPANFEDITYCLGIKNKFLIKFNEQGITVEH